ncbi:MAG: hypothetical protein Fues2KO_46490 [Fuerstiella sp.]
MNRTVPDLIATIALLDEPFKAPDDETRAEMYQLLQQLTADGAITTQHVTHRKKEARQPASRRFVLNATVIH